MKYLKLYENFDNLKKEVIDFIEKNYDEVKTAEMFDDEIFSSNWVDNDWDEDGEYESEYDWYVDHGRGEVEYAVIETIKADIISKIPGSEKLDLHDIIVDLRDLLNTY